MEQTFQIRGMDCASCARTIENGVSKLAGVETCSLNFTTETLRIAGKVKAEDILARVRELGYEGAAGEQAAISHEPKPGTSFGQFLWQRLDTRFALLGALLILPGLVFHELLPGLGIHHPLLDITSVVAMAVAGFPIARSAWRAVRINHEININVLMTIAAIGAVVIGAYTEAGLVMVLFALGEALEGYTSTKARESIRQLMEVAPQQAVVLRPCWDCQGHMGQDGYTGGPCPFCGVEEQKVAVTDLAVGDRIIVKPGERVPMDGRILAGSSAVNQAPITGESRLIEKAVGDGLFASSINGEGTLEVEVTHLAADNTIARLIKMVEEAQEKRAPAQRLVDQFARIYTPAVVLLAVLVAVIPPLFFDLPFWNSDATTQGWFYRALALLVVACPCALVISTPVSLVSAISNAARQGVLVKGGAYLELLSRVKAVAFDKTGTLTQGKPSVVAVRSVGCSSLPNMECANCNDLVALAQAVEQRSEHPLAQAVLAEAAHRGVGGQYPAAEQVKALTGRGVTGLVNGRFVTIASHTHFEQDLSHQLHCDELTQAAAQGYTTLLVSDNDQYAGYMAVTDAVRESGKTAVSALQTLGIDTIMLTGDNEATARQIGQQVGVTNIRANCLPQDKVSAVSALKQQYQHVAMVGDGINDTPALATASVGIAMGKTAQVMETADITLMGDDLNQLPFAIKLSRATVQTIQTNIALSLGIKFLFLLLVLLGWGSLWLAVLADMGTSLAVTLNGMRLMKYRSEQHPVPNDQQTLITGY